MSRAILKKFALGAVAAIGVCALGASSADAFWGHGGSYGGSYGGGSSGGSMGGYSAGSYGGGSHGGGFFRRHFRRGGRAAYHSSGGSYGGMSMYGGWASHGGYGSGGGGSAGYGSYGGSYGGAYGGYGVQSPAYIEPYRGDDYAPPPPGDDYDYDLRPEDADRPEAEGDVPPPDVPSPGDSTRYRASLRSAMLNVRVPAEAKVYVNGIATTSRGTLRRYVSNGLRPGYDYTYELRAEVVRDGRTLSETRTVRLQAGQSTNLEFAFADREQNDRVASEPVRTRLTLHVPADAKVYLSGNETDSYGEVREFTTTRMAPGQQWQDYVVRVEVEREGELLAREEKLSLRAGDDRELTVDFDAPQVARVN